MPKIPVANFRRQVSMENTAMPTQSIAQAGMVGEAISSVGQGVAQAGQGFGALVQARQKADVENFTNEMKKEYERENTTNKQFLDDAYRGTTWGQDDQRAGYTNDRRSFVDTKKNEFLKKADNASKKELVNNYFSNRLIEVDTKDATYENERRTEQYKLNTISFVDARVSAAGGLDFASLRSNMQDTALTIMNSNILESQDKMKLEKSVKEMVPSKLNTMLANGGADLQRAKQFLSGKTQFGDLLEALSPEERAKYVKAVDDGIEREKNKLISDMVTKSNNLESSISLEFMRTGTVSPETLSKVNQTRESLSSFGNDPRIASLKNDLDNVLIVSKAKADFKKMSIQQVNEMNPLALIKTLGEGEAAGDLRAVKALQTEKEAYIKSLISDPIGVQIKEDPSLIEGSEDVKNALKQRGIITNRTFSKTTESRIAEQFKQGKDKGKVYQDLVNEFVVSKYQDLPPGIERELSVQQGELAFRKGLAEAASRNKSLMPVIVATEFDDPTFASKMMSLNKDTIDKAFAEKYDFGDTGKQAAGNLTVDTYTTNALKPFLKEFGREDNFSIALKERAKVIVKDMMLDSDSLSAEDAAVTVAGKIAANYSFVKSGDQSIVISGVHRNYVDQIDNFVTGYDNTPAAIAQDFKVDLKNQRLLGFDGNETPQELVQILKESADLKWELNNTRDGLNLTYVSGSVKNPGGKATLNTKDDKGNIVPIEVKFSDIYTKPDTFSVMGQVNRRGNKQQKETFLRR